MKRKIIKAELTNFPLFCDAYLECGHIKLNVRKKKDGYPPETTQCRECDKEKTGLS